MSTPITIEFRNARITFEDDKEAREFGDWSAYHQRATAKALQDEILGECGREQINALTFLNTDLSEILVAISEGIQDHESRFL